MSRRFLMGLDVGGGSGRSLLVDVDSGAVLSASRTWRFGTAPDTSGLGTDLDLELMWRLLSEASRELLARAGAAPSEVMGIAATGLRLGSVVLDRDGAPILAVPNRDARAAGPGLLMAAEHGERIFARMGRWPYPVFSAARLRWLTETDPAGARRAAHHLSISDWVTYKLCGTPVAEPSQAGESLLFDLASREWAWDWIDELGLSRELFPAPRECGSRAGALGSEAAADLGLSPGTPVGVGGADTQCGLLAAGAVAAGDVAIIAGTTAPVQAVVAEPLIDPKQRVWSGHHVVPGLWTLESNAGPIGEFLEWFGRLFFPDAPAPVARLFAEAGLSEPGARGLLSSAGARVMNARDMNLAVGALTLSHLTSELDSAPRHHLLRAVIEGVACALRANLEQLQEVPGVALGKVRVGGGLSRSPSFLRILANVLGTPIETMSSHQSSALGAAMCAGVAAGIYPDLASASGALARLDDPLEPAGESAEVYRTLYESWSQLHVAEEGAATTAANLFTPWYIERGAGHGESAAPRHHPGVLVAADIDSDSLRALAALGEVEYASFREQKRMLSGAALVEALRGFDVFVTEVDIVDAASLEALPDLRVVFACRGDAVNVDVGGLHGLRHPGAPRPGAQCRRRRGPHPRLLADALPPLSRRWCLPAPARHRGRRHGTHGPGLLDAPGPRALAQDRGPGRTRRRGPRSGSAPREPFGARVLVSDPYVSEEQAALAGARSSGPRRAARARATSSACTPRSRPRRTG